MLVPRLYFILMHMRFFALLIPILLQAQSYYSVPLPDAPELAPRGKYPVGVRTVNLLSPNQPDILHFDQATGKAPLYDRPLPVEVWYPAVLPAGAREHVEYEAAMPGTPKPGDPTTFRIAG